MPFQISYMCFAAKGEWLKLEQMCIAAAQSRLQTCLAYCQPLCARAAGTQQSGGDNTYVDVGMLLSQPVHDMVLRDSIR